MQMTKRLTVLLMTSLLLVLMGCGEEGPLGNNAPQGRPDWMKKKSDTPAAPAQPQRQ